MNSLADEQKKLDASVGNLLFSVAMIRLMRNREELAGAFKYSWRGFKLVWHGEVAFRQYTVIGALLIPVAFYLAESGAELSVLIGSILLILLVEIINTAIEAVVDRVGEEQHELSAAAKDLGSAAVFFSVVMFVITWLIALFT